MSIEILSDEIKFKLDQEIKELEDNLDLELKQLEDSSKKTILNYKSKLKEKYDLEFDLLKSKIIGSSNKLAKSIVLNEKNKILLDVKKEFLNRLLSLKIEERKDLFKNLLKKVLNNFNFDLIVSSKKDIKILKEVLTGLGKDIKNFKFLGDDSVQGIILYKNRTEKYDLTYGELANLIYENNEEKIQKILFNSN